MTLTIKQRETELAYLLKTEEEIVEELKTGPNGYLADLLKATRVSIYNQRNELRRQRNNERVPKG